ncbi:hypothetical protein EOD39_9146 [Acipenser ruthenus]|uniref:Uncharacterized protein n=1 Tax=Acipenser ruthenus TaxID=7906 RepID=A0A444U1R8_ACIRT|nr:hypothetical protein EOD39_9146 [Acipenser ruthenus]
MLEDKGIKGSQVYPSNEIVKASIQSNLELAGNSKAVFTLGQFRGFGPHSYGSVRLVCSPSPPKEVNNWYKWYIDFCTT